MRVLLDTHLLIWIAADRAKAGPVAIDLIRDPAVDAAFSAVSIWEITVKRALGRVDFRFAPDEIRDGCLSNDITEVDMTSAHGMAVAALPMLHRDPFDRLLLAQALVENRLLLTRDRMLVGYDVPVRLV